MKKIKQLFILSICTVITSAGLAHPVMASDYTDNPTDSVIVANEYYLEENYEQLIDSMLVNNKTKQTTEIHEVEDSGLYEQSCIIQDDVIADDNSSELHALTIGYVVYNPENNAVSPKAGGTVNSGWISDNTVSVKGYQTIYYYQNTSSGMTYKKLYKITGKYSKIDSSVSVFSQKVKYIQEGLNQSQFVVSDTGNYSPTSSSWSKSTGFSNYVYNTGYGLFGAKYTLTLTRNSGASTWSFDVNTYL